MILDTIIEKKKQHLLADLKSIQPEKRGPVAQAMKAENDLFIIGEIKKASPSKGVIVEDFDVTRFAKAYADAGIDAMSILTEQDFFLGDPAYIQQAKQYFHKPVLRKDFLMDIREVIQSRQMGADLILLIVAMLDDEQLRTFHDCARALGLECIVEVHNEEELHRALSIQPEIIGINNRNLHTFDVTLNTTETLRPLIPDDIAVIAESGIFTHEHMKQMQDAGADAVLIGESFMRSTDFTQHLKDLKYGTC